jgi:CDP-diacylglycerol--glycerol-3-phosphate 3-phosphatidyltransferase
VPLNLPNILTLLRVLAIPLLVLVFYLPGESRGWWAAILFAVAGVTDWFDGWLARRSGQTTAFGAFLDPVADKLIVAIALVLLVARMDALLITISACVVIGREVVVSALREWMAQLGRHASVAVTQVAKVKTAVQMVAVTVLLWQSDGDGSFFLRLLGELLLVIAVVLTLWSMMVYLKVFWRTVQETDAHTNS